jgi:ribonuclease T2
VVPPYKGPNVGTFVEDFGAYDLLNWMNTYWINQGAPNSDFWGHEFSKHATCYSTFDVPCYGPNYVEHQEVVEFFETAIKYYKRLPTWSWLKEANITPSNSTTYSLADIQGQLTKKYGAVPYVGCSGPRYNTTEQGMKENSTDSGRTVISEVWYYMHVSFSILRTLKIVSICGLTWFIDRRMDVLKKETRFKSMPRVRTPPVPRRRAHCITTR